MKRLKIGVMAAVVVTGLGLVSAPPASAAVHSSCVWQTICVYYSPNHAGSLTAFDQAYPDLSSPSFKFLSNGAGKGQNVYDNGASAENAHVSYHARVYSKKSYKGDVRVMTPALEPGYRINFGSKLRNNNRSLRFTLS